MVLKHGYVCFKVVIDFLFKNKSCVPVNKAFMERKKRINKKVNIELKNSMWCNFVNLAQKRV